MAKTTWIFIVNETINTGLFTRGVLLNFFFAATNNTNGTNYYTLISFKLEIKVSWIDLLEMLDNLYLVKI
jgi:hypothetical protein